MTVTSMESGGLEVNFQVRTPTGTVTGTGTGQRSRHGESFTDGWI